MSITTTWSDGNVVIRLDMTELQSLIDNLEPRAREIVGKVAFRAEGHMKQLAAVDTGAMKNSIDTEFFDVGLTAHVGPHVDYAIYQEFGTHKMAAHPFIVPGLEEAGKDLEQLCKELFIS